MPKQEKEETIFFTQEDFTDIANLFTNTRARVVADRDQTRELLDDEDAIIAKMLAIEKERNDLLKKVKKLEKSVSKDSK